MDIIWKILGAVAVLFIIGKFLQPVLVGFYPPLGIIILIILFVAVVAWVMGKF